MGSGEGVKGLGSDMVRASRLSYVNASVCGGVEMLRCADLGVRRGWCGGMKLY